MGAVDLPTVKRPCGVIGCFAPSKVHRMCNTHYARWLRSGTTAPPVPPTFEERFWAKVVKGDGCWVWAGAKDDRGYASLGVAGRTDRGHRVSWKLAYGDIPQGLWVLHRCDNPPCVRPDHLFLGTARDNSVDMARKGRWGNAAERFQGENHWARKRIAGGTPMPTAKLSQEQVSEIRALHSEGWTCKALGNRFSVNPASVSRIVRHLSRRDVP